MEDQIVDMITIMCNVCAKQDYPKCEDRGGCICEELAEAYYKADYRKQKTGDWVKVLTANLIEDPDRVRWKCSSCGKETDLPNYEKANYCFNCGAKMEGDV